MESHRRTGFPLDVIRLLVVGAALASPGAFANESAPALTWTTSTGGEGVADQVAPGYTTVTLANDGDVGYTVTLFRLKEGATLEALRAATEAIDAAFSEGGDPVAAINNTLEMVEAMGETFADPGNERSFGVVLEEGSYALEGSTNSDEGPSARSYRSFTVSGEPQADAPEADVTVQLVDFAFALPPDIRAGPQLWHGKNVGKQLHHMVLFKLLEGKTMDDFTTWMEAEGEGEPAAEDFGGIGILDSGRSNYVSFDFTPGSYVALCFMPDHRGDASGQPHFMLGMMQTFTIAND